VAAIRAAADASWNNVDLNQREERIIHDYFRGQNGAGLKYLNQNISPLFLSDGFEVKFAGVFCHGQPKVLSFSGKTNRPATRSKLATTACELGDLHLVFTFLDQVKNLCDQRAILFQAKKAPSLGGASLIDHPDQSCLYEKAGSFDYKTMLNAGRNLPSYKDRDRSLHYLFCGSLPVRTSSACAPALINFGELLWRVLSDSEGLYFRKPTGAFPEWWDINWDLLKTIASAYYKQHQRGEGITDVLSHFNDFTHGDDHFLDLGEGSNGISTLFLIVRDRHLTPDEKSLPPKPAPNKWLRP
jgi:hypothetical protein